MNNFLRHFFGGITTGHYYDAEAEAKVTEVIKSRSLISVARVGGRQQAVPASFPPCVETARRPVPVPDSRVVGCAQGHRRSCLPAAMFDRSRGVHREWRPVPGTADAA